MICRSYTVPAVVALFHLLFIINASIGALINVTIDDTNGDARTGAKPDWVVGWQFKSASCQNPDGNPILATTCAQGVDPSLAYDGTWTGVTINATTAVLGGGTMMNLTFNGSAVYVYHIIPAETSFSELVFGISYSVDGETYALKSYAKTSETQYNQLAYAREGLVLTQHMLSLLIGDPGLPQMFFDYAVYTTDDGTESSSSSSTSLPSRTPASITSASMTPAHSKWSKVDIGAVVGGSAALVLVLGATAGILLYRRRGHNETRAAGESFIPDISIHGSTAHLGPCQQDQHWRNASNEQSAAFLSPNLNPTSSESFNSESEGSSSHAPLFVGRLLHQSSTPGTLPPTQHRTSLPSVDYRNSGTFISPGRRRTLQRGAEELRPPDYHSVVQRS